MRRAKRIARKRKSDSSPGGTSSAGEPGVSSLQGYEGLFDNSKKIVEIAKAAPGALTANLIRTTRES